MSSNTLNNVGIATARAIIHSCFADAFQRKVTPLNICLHGAPGVGKSAIVKQLPKSISETLGIEYGKIRVIDVRLGAMESSDVQGIPFVTVVDGNDLMKFSTPEWFPKDDGFFYIVFLDEITNASVAVQHAAYRLILDREIHNGTRLPDSTMLLAAGNRKEDKTGAKPLLPAAANRFHIHLNIEGYNDSITYFVEQRFNGDMVAFLESDMDMLYKNEGAEAAFATPRTWEGVHQILSNPMLTGDDNILRVCIAGAVGSVAAAKFMGFREYRHILPDWKRIREGDETYHYSLADQDRSIRFGVGISIAFQFIDCIDRELFVECANLCKLMDDLPREIKIVTFKTMKRDLKVVAKMMRHKELNAHFRAVSAYLNGTD